jgi:hypothetical protein
MIHQTAIIRAIDSMPSTLMKWGLPSKIACELDEGQIAVASRATAITTDRRG